MAEDDRFSIMVVLKRFLYISAFILIILALVYRESLTEGIKYFVTLLIFFLAIWLFYKYKIRGGWSGLPEWTRISMKSSLFAVILLFVSMIILSLIDMFRSDFRCSTCIIFGLCSGSSSLGACFAWPTIMFILGVIPAAIIGAVVGVIVYLIMLYVRRRKNG